MAGIGLEAELALSMIVSSGFQHVLLPASAGLEDVAGCLAGCRGLAFTGGSGGGWAVERGEHHHQEVSWPVPPAAPLSSKVTVFSQEMV